MIICFFRSELNDAAIKALKRQNTGETVLYYPTPLSNADDHETIYLLDLSGDGALQTLLQPKQLADYLVKNGLTEQTKTINFLLADTSMPHRLWGYAGELTSVLAEKHQRYVEAHVPSDLNEAAIFISPPDGAKTNWQVFSIHDRANCKTMECFSDYMKSEHRRLYWEGDDILKWLAAPGRTLEAPNTKNGFNIS